MPAFLIEAVDVVKYIVKKHDGDKFWPAKNEEEAEAMWTGRKNGHYAVRTYAGEGARAWSMDVWCVLTSGCCPHSLIPPLFRGDESAASRPRSFHGSYMKLSGTSSALE